MLKVIHKDTLYHLLFECERFRAIREDYPILNKSIKKVYKALDNDDNQQLMDYLNTVFSLLNIKKIYKIYKKIIIVKLNTYTYCTIYQYNRKQLTYMEQL